MRTSLKTGARRPLRTALAAVLSGLVWVSLAVVPAYAANPDTLSALSIRADGSNLTLSPSFASGTTSYTVPQIPWADRAAVEVRATSTDSADPDGDGGSTLEVRVAGDGSGTWFPMLDGNTWTGVATLLAGSNSVQVRVTSGGIVPTQRVYSISVPVGGAATTTTFSAFGCVFGCSLSPAFASGTREYVTSWLDDATDDLEMFYSLSDGATSFKMARWVDDETPPANADFSAAVLPSSGSVFIGASGEAGGDGPFEVGHIPSIYTFRVSSESGTTADYILKVYKRSTDDDSSLDNSSTALRLTAGSVLTLTQVDGGASGFVNTKKDYTTSVPAGTASVTVRATSSLGDEQLIEVRNSSATSTWTRSYSGDSLSVALVGGTNVIEVRVRAGTGPNYVEDTNQTTYTVTISGAGPATPVLTGLSLSSGTLTPAFASGTLNYTASVSSGTSNIDVTATSTATLTRTINGGSSANVTSGSSFNVPLAENAVTTLRVIATIGSTTATYVVAITRGTANPTLATLSLGSACTLAPVFTANTPPVSGGHTCTVAATTTSVNVAATPTTAGDKVEWRLGSGDFANASATINLAVGSNTIEVKVTKQGSGSQPSSTYRVVVTRPGSPGLTAMSLTANGKAVALSPAFSNTVYAYSAKVLGTSVLLSFTKSDANSTVKLLFDSSQLAVTGSSVTVPLDAGKNIVTLEITPSGGGASINYILEITAPRCKVVNVVGLSLKDARAKLKEKNCLVKVVRQNSSTVAKNRVISQDPVVSLVPKQNRRPPGFKVTLVVSKGP